MHTGSWGAGKAQGVQNQLLSLRRSEGAGAAEAAEKQGLGSGSQRKFWADSVWGEKTEVPAAQICTCDLSRPFPLKKCKDFRYWKIQGTASPLPPGGGASWLRISAHPGLPRSLPGPQLPVGSAPARQGPAVHWGLQRLLCTRGGIWAVGVLHRRPPPLASRLTCHRPPQGSDHEGEAAGEKQESPAVVQVRPRAPGLRPLPPALSSTAGNVARFPATPRPQG